MIPRIFQVIITLAILYMILVPRPVLAQSGLNPLSQAQFETLLEIKYSLATVDDLQIRGIISPPVAEAQRRYYLVQAQAVLGQPIEPDQLNILLAGYDPHPLTTETPGALAYGKGFFTFGNCSGDWHFSPLARLLKIAELIANQVPVTFRLSSNYLC